MLNINEMQPFINSLQCTEHQHESIQLNMTAVLRLLCGRKKSKTNWKIGSGNQISWFHSPLDGVYLCVCAYAFIRIDLHQNAKGLQCCFSSIFSFVLLRLLRLELFLGATTKFNDIHIYLFITIALNMIGGVHISIC